MELPPIQLVDASPDSSSIKIQLQQQQEQEQLNLLLITWNLMGTLPPQLYIEQLFNNQTLSEVDLIVIGTQECQKTLFSSFFCESKEHWESLLQSILNIQGYIKVESHVLQGLHLIVFAHSSKYLYISEKKKNALKTGFCNLIGNKGGISIELTVNQTKMSFINVHLAANQDEISHRNISLLQIMDRLLPHDKDEAQFIFGDMNYRMDINNQQSRIFNENSNSFNQYIEKDQLIKQKDLLPFFQKFEEGKIDFAPTYKMKLDRNQYVSNRIPGWTDRIFYKKSSKVKLLKYSSGDNIFGSDHRPVIGSFELKINKPNENIGQIQVKPSSGCTLF